MALIYENLSYEIRKAIFYVHNHTGYGFDEDAYHQGLIYHFNRIGLPFKSKYRKPIIHRSKIVATFEFDFLVYDKIILELKAVHSDFLPDHYRQIIEYLKLWQKRLGLLVNFGFELAKIKRVPFTEKNKDINEQYKHFANKLSDSEKKDLAEIRDAILEIFQQHGLGYCEKVYYELLKAEFDYREIPWDINCEVSITLDGEYLKDFSIPFFVLKNKYVVGLKSIYDDISSYDIARMISYLRKLNLKLGFFLNFGKQQLQIRGIYANR